MTVPLRFLGLSGSLRAGSYNTLALKTLASNLEGVGALTIFSLQSIPLYNQDLDGERPPGSVQELKHAIREADGLILSSPEYNYGMSGVLKNAIDWASRPAMQSVLRDKPVLLMTCSPSALGGARAHAQLRESMSACLAWVLPFPQITITEARNKFSIDALTDAGSLAMVTKGIAALAAFIQTRRDSRHRSVDPQSPA